MKRENARVVVVFVVFASVVISLLRTVTCNRNRHHQSINQSLVTAGVGPSFVARFSVPPDEEYLLPG